MRTFVQRLLAFAMVGLAAALSGRAIAQEDSAAQPSAGSPAEETEDITIRGQRTLQEYRLEIERARNVVVGLFNELNTEEGNDVTCKDERLTGTRMPQRVCRSKAANDSDAASAYNFLNILLINAGGYRTGTAGAAPGTPFTTMSAMAAAQRAAVAGKQASDAALTEEMQQLLKEHPDLYRAVVTLVELEDEYLEARGRTTEPEELDVSLEARPAVLVGSQCSATATTEYRQLNTIARVDAAIAISDCAAASGEFTVAVRVRDDAGTDNVLEFNETWQRSDDQDVKFTADYPIGENVGLMSTRIRGLTCTCAAPASAQ